MKCRVGEYSQPQIFTDNPYTKTRACRILFLKGRTDPHILNLKDDYSKIQQKALEYKQNEFMNKWIGDRISSYYIKIDPEYQDVRILKPGSRPLQQQIAQPLILYKAAFPARKRCFFSP